MERTDLERASSIEKKPIVLTSLGQDAETVPVKSVDKRSRCRWWIWFIPCSLFLLLLFGLGLWVTHKHDQMRYQCSAEALPSPRHEPWSVAFNKELSEEVARADAGQVLKSISPLTTRGIVPTISRPRNLPSLTIFLQELCRAMNYYSMATASQRHGAVQRLADHVAGVRELQKYSTITFGQSIRLKSLLLGVSIPASFRYAYDMCYRGTTNCLLLTSGQLDYVEVAAGDQTAHLMWRLQHGQLYEHSQPRLIVVMIGTNDLGAASCSGAWGIKRSAKGAADRSVTAIHHGSRQQMGPCMHYVGPAEQALPSQCFLNPVERVMILQGSPGCLSSNARIRRTLGMLRLLRKKNPGAHIIALAVLPRGWTDAWHVYDWPNMYKGGIDVINRALKDFPAQSNAVTYLDCGPALLPDGKVSAFLCRFMRLWDASSIYICRHASCPF